MSKSYLLFSFVFFEYKKRHVRAMTTWLVLVPQPITLGTFSFTTISLSSPTPLLYGLNMPLISHNNIQLINSFDNSPLSFFNYVGFVRKFYRSHQHALAKELRWWTGTSILYVSFVKNLVSLEKYIHPRHRCLSKKYIQQAIVYLLFCCWQQTSSPSLSNGWAI